MSKKRRRRREHWRIRSSAYEFDAIGDRGSAALVALILDYHPTMTTLALLVAGVAVGILSGLVGIGGGVFIIPILVYGFGLSQHKAQGTSLGALLAPIGLFAFFEYYKAGNVDIRAAILIAIGFMLGGFLGAR